MITEKTRDMLIGKYFKFQGGCLEKPLTDEEYLNIVQEDYVSRDLYKRALMKLGLDEEQVKEAQPIEFKYFVFNKNAQYGPSGLYTNLYQVSWFFFSEKEMYIYSITLDILSLNAKEICEEYFYKDVTSVSSNLESIEVISQDKRCSGVKNVYGVKEFSSLKVVVPGDQLILAIENNTETEEKIHSIKQILRKKKD